MTMAGGSPEKGQRKDKDHEKLLADADALFSRSSAFASRLGNIVATIYGPILDDSKEKEKPVPPTGFCEMWVRKYQAIEVLFCQIDGLIKKIEGF